MCVLYLNLKSLYLNLKSKFFQIARESNLMLILVWNADMEYGSLLSTPRMVVVYLIKS